MDASPAKLVLSRPQPHAVSRTRRNIALVFAGVADLVQGVFFPVTVEGAMSPVDIAIDAVTGIVLLVTLGFHWRLAFALALELVPGVDLFPTWTAVVISMPVLERAPDVKSVPPSLPPA